jgi:hypothetical protein
MGIGDEVLKIEIIEGLQRALDKNFHRMRENARHEWENHFAKPDPSDACVSVRIHTAAKARLSALPAAGFVAPKARPQSGTMQALLA